MQPPPPLESLVSVEFLIGFFPRGGGYVLCVDVDRILGADESTQVAELSRHLARGVTATPKAARRAYLCVRLDGERCALPLTPLREINPCGPIAWIPGAAGFVLGATNVRGAIVPVVDVARRYGLGRMAPDAGGAAPRRRGPGTDDGGNARRLHRGLAQVPEGDLNTTPPFGVRFPAEVVLAMAPVAGGFVPSLDTSTRSLPKARHGGQPRRRTESTAA
jgi:purine-binding chemotaxis protein CheW